VGFENAQARRIRHDDESVAGALNEALFELVGDVLGAVHHCPRALRSARY
jgi:hypothetical protein